MESKQKVRPEGGKFLGFDHITFWVGNAKQTASFYTTRFGFQYYAYKGLQTGTRNMCTHVVRNNNGITYAFCSPYHQQMNHHLIKHGDGVKDIAFTVQDATAIYNKAIKKGAKSVKAPQKLETENGYVIIASIHTYGDTIHTFVQRDQFKGIFLPGFQQHPMKQTLNNVLPQVVFQKIDHCVGNLPDGQMQPMAQFYENVLDFHRFWSVDDSIIHTDYSSLRSIVVTDYDEVIKMPINQPANGKKISQIQEYVDYYGGAGVQHIAMKTQNIIQTIENMRYRGIEFLTIPDTYYDNLRKNLPHLNFKINQDVDLLQKNKILVDYDDKGYLLQIFTKPVEDRPTLFFEVIERHNHQGFGAGNFKALFLSIEQEQQKRGNLTQIKPL